MAGIPRTAIQPVRKPGFDIFPTGLHLSGVIVDCDPSRSSTHCCVTKNTQDLLSAHPNVTAASYSARPAYSDSFGERLQFINLGIQEAGDGARDRP
jgi:hypothetical protein